MKNKLMLIPIGLIFIASPAVHAEESRSIQFPKIQVKVKNACNEEVCGIGYNINGTSYVPIRVVMESIGATVEWDDQTKTVHIIKKDNLQTSDEKYIKATNTLYEEIENELKLLTLLNEQIELSFEFYEKFNESQWISYISDGKLREREMAYKNISKKINENLEAYGGTNPDILNLIDVADSIKDIISHYQISLDSLKKYMDKKELEQYRNYLLFREYALEKIEVSIAKVNEIKHRD